MPRHCLGIVIGTMSTARLPLWHLRVIDQTLRAYISISRLNFVDVIHKSFRPFQALIGQMGLVNFCLVVSSG